MRERWFFAQGAQRRGPFTLAEIVTAVRGEPDPRAALVWRKGLREWTLAEAVTEIEQRLAPPSSAEQVVPSESAAEPHPASKPAPPPAPARLRMGVALIAAVAGITAVVLQLRSSAPVVTAPGPVAASPPATAVPSTSAPATPPPAPGVSAVATPAAAISRALAAEEAELSDAELHKLRGVAAWAGDTLKLTVYNATAWRVTQLQVRLERLSGEDFVADEHPLTLVPPPQRVDVGVADLLARVAPDRKKPGLNPLDTGVFEARAGAAPEGFRWEFESARGYPPLR
jgi:hypothetical protein